MFRIVITPDTLPTEPLIAALNAMENTSTMYTTVGPIIHRNERKVRQNSILIPVQSERSEVKGLFRVLKSVL